MFRCSDADDDEDDDDGKGLFDESDDDEPKKPLSKREKLEALQAKKRQHDHSAFSSREDGSGKPKKDDGTNKDGYGSEDTYNSAEFVRTAEDNDFIDVDDDDPDAINELYAEQHFDDERPEEQEDTSALRKKQKSSSGSRGPGLDSVSDDDNDNPIMAAVNKMKRKKPKQKTAAALEDEAKEFVGTMENAADDDEDAFKGRRPATKKLAMLGNVVNEMTKRDMIRPLLDADILAACKRWIQPLPNGKLGNVTVRQRILEAVAGMNGENGINSLDLKRSGIGHTIMALYKHRSETPSMKRNLKKLIEQWSRPIFQKSGNMRDLEHAHATRRDGLTAAARMPQKQSTPQRSARVSNDSDLRAMIASGNKGAQKEGLNRVRVPFSKGFQFTVRPQNKAGNAADKRMARAAMTKDNRGNLSKRMLEKSRVATKNQRSANLSVEGRPVK